MLLEDALEASRAWRCPRVKCSPGALDNDHVEALGAVERVTGYRFRTCPIAGTVEPWVHRAVDAEEHGLAEDRAAYGAPPKTLVDAVGIIRRARRARDAAEQKK